MPRVCSNGEKCVKAPNLPQEESEFRQHRRQCIHCQRGYSRERNRDLLKEETSVPRVCSNAERCLAAPNQVQPASEFKFLRRQCATCVRAYNAAKIAEWRKENPKTNEERAAKFDYQAWHLKKKYGLSKEEYEEKLAAQGGGCEICGTKEAGGQGNRFHVDHDHETGVIRGLLCNICNVGLGSFKDRVENLNRAMMYLLKYKFQKS